MLTLNCHQALAFSPLHRLQWEVAQEKYVILYPEGMVELNQSSAEILKLCDGSRHVKQIVSELEQLFQTQGIEQDVIQFLTVALNHGWIIQN